MFKKKEKQEEGKTTEELRTEVEKLKAKIGNPTANPDVEIGKGPKAKAPVKREIWVLGEVATQTTPVFVNTKTDEQLDLHSYWIDMGNKIEKILEAIG